MQTRIYSKYEIDADKEGYAERLAEGSTDLKKLLLYCFYSEIETSACCAGHGEEKLGYIAFIFNQSTKYIADNVVKKLMDESLELAFTKNTNGKMHFSVINHSIDKSTFFKDMLEIVKDKTEGPYISNIIGEIFNNYSKENSGLQICIKKENGKFSTSYTTFYLGDNDLSELAERLNSLIPNQEAKAI